MKYGVIRSTAERITGLSGTAATLALAALLAGIAALLLNLGAQPFFLEEPRRVMVAMEMWANGNILVPRQLGEYYYRKPPFFNWVLLLMARLWGDYSEWALRLPTVLSTLGMGGLSYLMGRRYVNAEFGWLSGLLFIGASGILFDFSMLAEIDLFYSMITYAAILSIFHFYQQGRYFQMFLALYLLTAIGILTKGLPSVAFAGISVIVFLASEKRWRLLFGWRHILSGSICLLIVGVYLAAYDHYHDLRPFLQMQLGESSQRTVAEQGFGPLITHLIVYPLDGLKNILPAGLLLLFLVRKNAWSLIRGHSFLYFSFLMLTANFLPYWLAPGARQRYIYALYPFAVLLLTYAYQHRSELAAWRTKVFQIVTGALLIILLLGSIVVPFLPDFQFLPYRYALAPVFGLLFAGLFYGFRRHRKQALYWLILASFFFRLLFDLTVLPQRAHRSGAQADRELAYRIQEIVGEEELHIYCSQRISFTTVVYLNKLRDQPLERQPDKNTEAFFLLQKIAYDDPREVFLTFEYDGRTYELVKFE